MHFLRQVLSPATMDQIEAFQETAMEVWDQVQDQYQEFENAVCREARKYIPDHLQPLVRKVMRSLPQTLACLALLGGCGSVVTTLFWAAHAVWVVLPLFAAFANGRPEGAGEDWMTRESLQRLQELYERFKPVILVSCAVAAAAFAVAGLFTLQAGLFVAATGAAAVATLAYETIDFAQLRKEDVPLGHNGHSS